VLEYKPVLLGRLFKAIGNRAPSKLPAKAAWFQQDIKRCARRHGIPFIYNPHFPLNSMLMMRAATGLLGSAQFSSLL
jgi:2-hydroxychromene-2-carboxylate isomerase